MCVNAYKWALSNMAGKDLPFGATVHFHASTLAWLLL